VAAQLRPAECREWEMVVQNEASVVSSISTIM